MGYSISNIQSNQGVQTNFESSGEDVSGNFKSPKGDQLTSNVVQTLNLKGSVINVTTDNDVVSVIINKHDHTSLRCQPVIQNDLWADPTALNKIVARAVEGKKTDIQYYHKNYLDHVYAVSDKDGDIKEHYRYSAFGEVEIYNTQGQKLAESAIDNDVLWNSRRFDGDTGLYYYKYRHYASKLGRWLGRDPIEEDGSRYNLYGFCLNDPCNWWDIYGLFSMKEIIGDFNRWWYGNSAKGGGTVLKDKENGGDECCPADKGKLKDVKLTVKFDLGGSIPLEIKDSKSQLGKALKDLTQGAQGVFIAMGPKTILGEQLKTLKGQVGNAKSSLTALMNANGLTSGLIGSWSIDASAKCCDGKKYNSITGSAGEVNAVTVKEGYQNIIDGMVKVAEQLAKACPNK